MRALLHITFFFTLLFSGGTKMHASIVQKNSSAQTLRFNIPVKTHHEFLHSKRGYSSTIIAFTDFDLNEEYSSGDDYNNSSDSNITKFKSSELVKWYLSNDKSLIATFPYNRFYFTKPLNGQSTPIYIAHSVLRI